MSFEIITRDCSVLSDGELSQMADLVASNEANIDFGYLSKAREEWVLVTEIRDGAKLVAFSFYTLERIGGTPAIIVGVLCVDRNINARDGLYALRQGQFRKALLAFPDEDVLVGAKLANNGGFEIFEELVDIVPRPEHKTSGEERAWARRLAKRYGGENRVDDRSFIFSGANEVCGYAAYEPNVRSDQFVEFDQFFANLDRERNDTLIAFGWVMAEELVKFQVIDD